MFEYIRVGDTVFVVRYRNNIPILKFYTKVTRVGRKHFYLSHKEAYQAIIQIQKTNGKEKTNYTPEWIVYPSKEFFLNRVNHSIYINTLIEELTRHRDRFSLTSLRKLAESANIQVKEVVN